VCGVWCVVCVVWCVVCGVRGVWCARRARHAPSPPLRAPRRGGGAPGQAKHVRSHLSKMRRHLQPPLPVQAKQTIVNPVCRRRLRLVDSADRRRCWERLQAYHSSEARAEHGDNWLTEQYMEMMVAASDDPAISYRMHSVELYEEDEVEAEGVNAVALAGEIGFVSELLCADSRGEGLTVSHA
jgi:hypothetical protein